MSVHLPETQYLDPEVLQKIGDLELIAREVVEGMRVGSHRSSLRGFSTEFAHHRQYSPGDPIRSIDWRFEGPEGEDPLTAQTDSMKESYLAGLNQFLDDLSTRCTGSHIDHTMANTRHPLNAVLSEVVLKRQNLSGPSVAAHS